MELQDENRVAARGLLRLQNPENRRIKQVDLVSIIWKRKTLQLTILDLFWGLV